MVPAYHLDAVCARLPHRRAGADAGPSTTKKKTPPHPVPPHRTAAADRARGAASAVGIGVEAGRPGGRTARLVPMATPTSSRSAALALSATHQGPINYLQL